MYCNKNVTVLYNYIIYIIPANYWAQPYIRNPRNVIGSLVLFGDVLDLNFVLNYNQAISLIPRISKQCQLYMLDEI